MNFTTWPAQAYAAKFVDAAAVNRGDCRTTERRCPSCGVRVRAVLRFDVSEVCIQISDSLRRSVAPYVRKQLVVNGVARSGLHAAVISQLRIPSLTPSQLFRKTHLY